MSVIFKYNNINSSKIDLDGFMNTKARILKASFFFAFIFFSIQSSASSWVNLAKDQGGGQTNLSCSSGSGWQPCMVASPEPIGPDCRFDANHYWQSNGVIQLSLPLPGNIFEVLIQREAAVTVVRFDSEYDSSILTSLARDNVLRKVNPADNKPFIYQSYLFTRDTSVKTEHLYRKTSGTGGDETVIRYGICRTKL